ncbi:MAG: hypothetical protein ACLSBB_14295 [Ruthenibacterium lactatiformans]
MSSTYLLYNYRTWGLRQTDKDYLQNTIPVHAEKPHHGHADEQSICALCSGGAVLLRDGGYRDALPRTAITVQTFTTTVW